jgi:hypothetical protein
MFCRERCGCARRCSGGSSTQRDFLILWRSGKLKVGGRPPEYLGTNGSNLSSLKLRRTARTRSGEVKATLAICATSIPWADSSTIWARRHRTTEPDERRTIWSRRLPPSLVISNAHPFAHLTSFFAKSQF